MGVFFSILRRGKKRRREREREIKVLVGLSKNYGVHKFGDRLIVYLHFSWILSFTLMIEW
jgi:hypothetical protein